MFVPQHTDVRPLSFVLCLLLSFLLSFAKALFLSFFFLGARAQAPGKFARPCFQGTLRLPLPLSVCLSLDRPSQSLLLASLCRGNVSERDRHVRLRIARPAEKAVVCPDVHEAARQLGTTKSTSVMIQRGHGGLACPPRAFCKCLNHVGQPWGGVSAVADPL